MSSPYRVLIYKENLHRKRQRLLSLESIYDIPTYASSITGGTRQHLLAIAFVLLLRRDIPFTLLAPFLS